MPTFARKHEPNRTEQLLLNAGDGRQGEFQQDDQGAAEHQVQRCPLAQLFWIEYTPDRVDPSTFFGHPCVSIRQKLMIIIFGKFSGICQQYQNIMASQYMLHQNRWKNDNYYEQS